MRLMDTLHVPSSYCIIRSESHFFSLPLSYEALDCKLEEARALSGFVC